MKFSLATIALAAAAVASPHNNPPTGGTCNQNGSNSGKVLCCNSVANALGQLLCNVLAIGNHCNDDQSSYCCDSNAQGGLINVDLGCTKIN